MMREIVKDSVDQSVVIRIVDSVDGTPENAVVFNTAGIDLWYRREGAAKVAITEATLAALTTAHADGGFLFIGDGYYRLDLPDAAGATGANGVMVGGTVTGMVVVGCYIPLVDFSPYTALTAATIAAAVWAYVVEGSATAVQYFRIMASALFGKASGLGTVTPIFRDIPDTKPRITATADSSGNRTAVTSDGT